MGPTARAPTTMEGRWREIARGGAGGGRPRVEEGGLGREGGREGGGAIGLQRARVRAHRVDEPVEQIIGDPVELALADLRHGVAVAGGARVPHRRAAAPRGRAGARARCRRRRRGEELAEGDLRRSAERSRPERRVEVAAGERSRRRCAQLDEQGLPRQLAGCRSKTSGHLRRLDGLAAAVEDYYCFYRSEPGQSQEPGASFDELSLPVTLPETADCCTCK